MNDELRKTQREFSSVETGIYYSLYMDNADRYYLIIDKNQGEKSPTIGTQANGFFICSHTGVTIKINNTKQVALNMGTFYNLKEGEKITHKKYTGFSRFTKI
jgi:hypothetical protein